ncbi:ribosome biosynthesis protein rrb1 [Chytridiales sp. JEL 0842]|nr:ribosome biosynthesis protein rrb1 [Chytridiales sp. JEL 0842]
MTAIPINPSPSSKKRLHNAEDTSMDIAESSSPSTISTSTKLTKRSLDDSASTAATHDQQLNAGDEDEGMGEFEDAWEDEQEEEDEDVIIAQDSEDEEMDVDGAAAIQEEEEDEPAEEDLRVYMPGQELQEGEVLVPDNSVYEMLHSMQVEWPCLSFDFLHDNLGQGRTSFPMTVYAVAGSQAERAKDNKIYVMKMSELHRTKHDDDDEMDDDENDLDDDPVLEHRTVPHNGPVNRIRTMQHPESHIVSTWSEVGKVYIWDLTSTVASLDTPGLVAPKNLKPLHTVDRHSGAEGFAMDWSSLQGKHRLLTGDVRSKIYLTVGTPTGFVTEPQPFVSHTDSVEDIQWSPSEGSVFASSSVDKTIRIWDVRARNKAQISWVAHDSDVNVISWNRLTDSLLASGSDSGAFSIWDLRTVATNPTSPTPAASFSWHKSPITSLEWHPVESSMLAVSGADNQVTLWDLALERDDEEKPVLGENGVEVPPQLLFVHMGQEDVKEVHWHKSAVGVLGSTAASGFNVFKTINS